MTPQILTIITSHLSHRMIRPEVTPDTLFEAINLDQIERDGIGVDIEVEFGVELTDAEIAGWRSGADILACLGRVG